MDDEWTHRAAVAAFDSHRLIGWIYWDPTAIANYAALGVPDGLGYYITTRAAPLAAAGPEAVVAAFGSIHPDFIRVSLDLCLQHTTFEAAAGARDAAVVEGLRAYAPELVDDLAGFADELWAVADALHPGGRVLFAAHRGWPRPDDPLLSAWLAVNCIREWRGDLHWALQLADGLSMTAAMVLDGAWRHYTEDWLPKSRGSDDESIAEAMDELAARGFVTDGQVNAEGRAHRQWLEDRLDELGQEPWRLLGAERTDELVAVIDCSADALMTRIDDTAGPQWMPAGRIRPGSTA